MQEFTTNSEQLPVSNPHTSAMVESLEEAMRAPLNNHNIKHLEIDIGEEYNSLVDEYNSLIDAYDNLMEKHNNIIDAYNNLVEEQNNSFFGKYKNFFLEKPYSFLIETYKNLLEKHNNRIKEYDKHFEAYNLFSETDKPQPASTEQRAFDVTLAAHWVMHKNNIKNSTKVTELINAAAKRVAEIEIKRLEKLKRNVIKEIYETQKNKLKKMGTHTKDQTREKQNLLAQCALMTQKENPQINSFFISNLENEIKTLQKNICVTQLQEIEKICTSKETGETETLETLVRLSGVFTTLQENPNILMSLPQKLDISTLKNGIKALQKNICVTQLQEIEKICTSKGKGETETLETLSRLSAFLTTLQENLLTLSFSLQPPVTYPKHSKAAKEKIDEMDTQAKKDTCKYLIKVAISIYQKRTLISDQKTITMLYLKKLVAEQDSDQLQKITDFNNFLDDETEEQYGTLLEDFKDPITLELMEIPICIRVNDEYGKYIKIDAKSLITMSEHTNQMEKEKEIGDAFLHSYTYIVFTNTTPLDLRHFLLQKPLTVKDIKLADKSFMKRYCEAIDTIKQCEKTLKESKEEHLPSTRYTP